jgi:stage III sporulation protein SpoIIIAA
MVSERKTIDRAVNFIHNKLVNLRFENFQAYYEACGAATDDITTILGVTAIFCGYSIYYLEKQKGNDNTATLKDAIRRVCRTGEVSDKLYAVFDR